MRNNQRNGLKGRGELFCEGFGEGVGSRYYDYHYEKPPVPAYSEELGAEQGTAGRSREHLLGRGWLGGRRAAK